MTPEKGSGPKKRTSRISAARRKQTAAKRKPKPKAQPKVATNKAVKKAPTIRRPEIKAPAFVSNASLPKPVAGALADLRERGLLPIALLLVVAIVAVPFLLSSGSEAPPPKSGQQASATEVAIATAPEAQPVVLKAGQGVRDFKQRLDESASKDPFKQQYAAPEASAGDTAAGAGGSATTAPAGGGGGGATTGDSGAETPATGSGSSGSLQFAHYEIDAYTGPADHLKLHHGIAAADPIPNQATPVAIFIGVTDHAKKAVLSVSSQVTAVSGDFDCPLSDACSLIQLAPGKTAKFQYAPNGKIYAIKFIRTELVVSKQP